MGSPCQPKKRVLGDSWCDRRIHPGGVEVSTVLSAAGAVRASTTHPMRCACDQKSCNLRCDHRS